MNVNDPDFKRLEELNVLIDVCIDAEDLVQVNNIIDAEKKINRQDFNKCFTQGERKYTTHDDNWERLWKKLLTGYVTKVGEVPLTQKRTGKRDLIKEFWSHLFYAKWLRANIQQKNYSDCYIRRLDEVAEYLERRLPIHTGKELYKHKDEVIRLTLMYFMELSAICQLSESQGYSERARRVIKDANYSLRIEYQNE